MLGYQRQNQRLQLAEGYAKHGEKPKIQKWPTKYYTENYRLSNMKTTKLGVNLYAQEG